MRVRRRDRRSWRSLGVLRRDKCCGIGSRRGRLRKTVLSVSGALVGVIVRTHACHAP
jgi:hypothetical protein